MTTLAPPEVSLGTPLFGLFPQEMYWSFEQVPLGRKRIDWVFVDRDSPHHSISVELKVSDWRKALWQAAVNLQLSQKSYIGLWHVYTHRVTREVQLLERYGVGLIGISDSCAEILVESNDPIRRLSRDFKKDWYQLLLDPR